MESLDKEFGSKISINNYYFHNTISKKAYLLTENVYNKYKNLLDLQFNKSNLEFNIIFTSSNNNSNILFPKDFIESRDWIVIFNRFKNLLATFEYGNVTYDYIVSDICRIIFFNNETPKSVKVDILEKIRFFAQYINEYPNFDYETFPIDAQNKFYQPLYSRYKKRTYYHNFYNNKIKTDPNFFKIHVILNPIPAFNTWNLSFVFIESENFSNFNDKESYYPIQVFENLDGSINSILALISDFDKKNFSKNEIINKVEITNNFNFFNICSKKHNNRVYPFHNPFFDAYTLFLDELASNYKNPFYSRNNFNFTYFTKSLEDETVDLYPFMTKDTIKSFNLMYTGLPNQFYSNYYSKVWGEKNPHKILFNMSYFYRDFDYSQNFLLTIDKKRRNVNFENLIIFLKNWMYQTIIYEFTNKILIYGYLLPKFDYYKELVYIKELMDAFNIKFEILIGNIHFSKSNISFYNLPSSNQFSEDKKEWTLSKIFFPMNINAKNQFVKNQINNEVERNN